MADTFKAVLGVPQSSSFAEQLAAGIGSHPILAAAESPSGSSGAAGGSSSASGGTGDAQITLAKMPVLQAFLYPDLENAVPATAPFSRDALSQGLDRSSKAPLVACAKALGGNPATKADAVVFLTSFLWGKLAGVAP